MRRWGGVQVVHIAGAPGSGKTTLGRDIARTMANVAVKDTDEFIQRDMPEANRLRALADDLAGYDSEWRAIWRRSVTQFIAANRNKLVIFVGLTDHFASHRRVDDESRYYDLTLHCPEAKRFYLDVPMPVLLDQYYGRLSHVPATSRFANENTPGTPRAIVADALNIREYHVAHGYAPASGAEIRAYLVELTARGAAACV